MKVDQKIVLVTRETRLAGLKKRFSTRSQAKFYVKQAVQAERLRAAPKMALSEVARQADIAYSDYENEDQFYQESLDRLHAELDLGLRVQVIDRSFLPTFIFGPNDIVVTVGQDGLVANTAKYALGLPIVAVNPDPRRFDGVLLPFGVADAGAAVLRVIEGKFCAREVTLAEARLGDHQRMLAFNDLFIGARSHVSARYRIERQGHFEAQSSSGVLVSTGAGSTGWLSSVFNMAQGLAQVVGGTSPPIRAVRMRWEDPRLAFVVREPFVSKHSAAGIVAGMIEPRQELILESLMPSDGVIFSDGIESDYLQFNSGAIVHIRSASERARLVVPSEAPRHRARG